MIRVLESGAFIALAVSMHLGVLGFSRETGQQSAGAGGQTSVTLVGSLGSLEAMVDEWKRPPDILPEPMSPEAPLTAPVEMNVTIQQPAPALKTPAQVSPPDMANALPTRLPDAVPPPVVPEMPADIRLLPPTEDMSNPTRSSEPPPRAAPQVAVLQDHAPAEALPKVIPSMPAQSALQRSDRPKPRPDPAPTPKEPNPASKQNSQAAPAQAKTQARGSGGGSNAGNAGPAQSSTISAGQKANIMATWSSQIQRRIQQKLVYPRSAQRKGIAGKVVVRLSIDTSGQVLASTIVQSAGSPILDDAALSTIARIGRFPTAPQDLGGGQFLFNVPVVFRN